MIVDGWFDWAIKHPGHPGKKYPQPNTSAGIVWHSAEGWLSYLLSYVQQATGASWTGSIALNGMLYQHYPVTTAIWASGSPAANGRFWAFESEGVAGTPLTEAQVQTALRIAREFEAFTGLKATRDEPRTMWQHREMTRFGSDATACPSGRYDGFFAVLAAGVTAQEEDMTPDEVRAIVREVRDNESGEVDEPLRLAMVERMRLLHLATDIDIDRVQRAVKVLRENGFQV